MIANAGTDAEVAVAAAQAGAAVLRAMFGSAHSRAPLHAGAGGLIAAADRQTHAALLEMIRGQTPPRP